MTSPQSHTRRARAGRAVETTTPRPAEIDHSAVQRAARELLRALGADVESDGLRDTPRRMADAYTELLTPQPFRATTFPNDDGYDELIVARAIPFHSLCMHHLLPVSRRRAHRLPARRADHRPEQARPRRRAVRPRPADPGAADDADRRLAAARARAQGRRRRAGGRAPVHVAARRAEVRRATVTSALHGSVRDDARTRQEFLAPDHEDIP